MDFNEEDERTPEEQEFIDIMNERGISFDGLNRETLLKIIENSQIMDLIRDGTINLQNFINLDEEILEYIIEHDDIIEALREQQVDFDDLIDCLKDNLGEFSQALENYSVEAIMDLYGEDPLHLKFIGGDPYDMVYMNADDEGIVSFALEHRYIDDDDICAIRNELLQPNGEESHDNVMFDSILDQLGEEEESDP